MKLGKSTIAAGFARLGNLYQNGTTT